MAKALVTGGAGFIGSHLVDYLIEQSQLDVVVLDDLSGGALANLHPRAEFANLSILDHAGVDALFERHRFDYVYHLAAYAAEGLSHFIKRFNYANNLIGSVNLINASVNHGVRCFVFTSSIAAYGAGALPMREDSAPHPEDSYGIAKLAVEKELAISHEMFGLPYVVFRPHNVYGERQNLGDPYRNVVGIFMNKIMRGEDLLIFGDGGQRRAFTYVGDVAPAIAEAPFLPHAANRVFNVGSDEHLSVLELAEIVSAEMRVPLRVRHADARNEVKFAYPDHERFRQTFGAVKMTPLRVGINRMANWALATGARSSVAFEGIEISKNLPASWRGLVSGRLVEPRYGIQS